MAIHNSDVVYFTTSDIAAMSSATDHAGILNKGLAAAGQPPVYVSPHRFGGPNDFPPPTTFRVRIVVVNRLDVDIENRRAYDIHGFLSGQPVVMTNGQPTRKPSTDPAKGGTSLGDVSLDWIDAPPPGYGSIGIWAFDQSVYFITPSHGVSAVLQLEVAAGPTVVVCAIVNATESEQAWLAQVVDPGNAVPDLDDFYDTCDNLTSYPASVTGKTVKATLQWQKSAQDGYFLFVYLDPTT